MPYKEDLSGRQFGRWTVKSRGDSGWLCVCQCKNEKEIPKGSLVSGRSKSCGCLNKKITSVKFKKHGMTDTPIYRIWTGMMTRCYNSREPSYKNYGGRGITVCKEWHTFASFLADVGIPPEGMSLDRHPDIDGDYAPGNWRWATDKQQARNRRNNVKITVCGKDLVLAEACELYGVSQNAVSGRVWYWRESHIEAFLNLLEQRI